MNKSVSDTYDRLASAYANNVDTESPYNSYYERPAMMSMIPDSLNGKAVLDAGCAAGWYAEQLVKRGAKVTGIDISKKMVDEARKRLNGKAEILHYDLQDALPFEANSFDYIVSSLTLHYLREWGFTFQEWERVLQPGGYILFSVHHPFMDFSRLNCKDYFEKKLINETWKKSGVTTEVSFYRRSLQDIISQTTEFFMLETLFEPRPQEKMNEVDESTFNYLINNPHFLIIQAKSRK
ncbi:class I SAM-dependent methyltransferase [Peribacillus sp. SCS-155]|uniref:class I SAM-dependent methyltransferase n=1 Tax=Peribacillus sedimenti TaxID=3115297 RepID=UPI00390602B9